MAQESTPESAGSARPFKYCGNQGEFTLLAPVKPGRAEKAWEIARTADERFNEVSKGIHSVGTLHDVRITLIDNDTRMLFAAVYDGDWDQYINDFAAGVVAGDLAFLDLSRATCLSYPRVPAR